MYQRIAVAVDGSRVSDRALDEAIGVARLTHATLLLLHVCEEIPLSWNVEEMSLVPLVDVSKAFVEAGRQLLAKASAHAAQAGVHAETRLVEDYSGRIGAVISEEARNWAADLLVIGSHGRTGLDRWLMGSVAENVMRTASMPVLLVRGSNPDKQGEL
ncbi:MAG: universal stress protein [Sideroxydans sp.]